MWGLKNQYFDSVSSSVIENVVNLGEIMPFFQSNRQAHRRP